MSTNDHYKILFETVKIGPVISPNRFYQVPHCCGLGHVRPRAHAAMRGMKAEGGWGVVSTEETEIHPSSDLSPYAEQRIWDERDIPALKLMTDAVHEHGALAAIELVHNGYHAQNHMSRAPVLAPSDTSLSVAYPKQARAMSKSDIREFRRWHRLAARRAKQAGFDIIYVYAGHNMSLPQHFLLPELNQRTDEYGGCLENRVRLIRELLEETHEEVGDTCAVAFRFAVDEMKGKDGFQWQEEGRAVVEMLADLPDLWDVNVSNWSNDSATSRFEPNEGYQTPYTEFVKKVTNKPVVAVGRFTSPDNMVAMVQKGLVDFIGSARPSIADPFLPNKILEDRIDEIRECIGCNICVSSDNLCVPIRCTQNPTVGEEWRRGWHPEKIQKKNSIEEVLIVGAGAAGLECAMQMARRGYQVTLAEANRVLGGRVIQESSLIGLNNWRRVADYRIFDLNQRPNINIYFESKVTPEDVLEFGVKNVFIATGASWRKDGVGHSSRFPIAKENPCGIYSPDEIMNGEIPANGSVLIFDDEQAYMGGVLAEQMIATGLEVDLVTPANMVSPFTELTLEQAKIQKRLIELGVRIHTGHQLVGINSDHGVVACVYTDQKKTIPCSNVILVTEKIRNCELHESLEQYVGSELDSLTLIGDASSPGLIADAVYSGHKAAREFEADPIKTPSDIFRREMTSLD